MHNVEIMKYLIDRKSKMVYAVNVSEGIIYDEINIDSWDYEQSEAYNNPNYSEISEQLYIEFMKDAETEKMLNKFGKELDKFAKAAQEMTRLWDELPNCYNDVLSTEYPFKESFDEIADKILFWKETLDK